MAEEVPDSTATLENAILYEPEVDTFAGVMFGVQAIVGSVWWILTMFIYVKNTSADADLTNIAGTKTVPLAWFWERIAEYQGTKVWLAVSLLFTFLFYAAVSVTEVVAWVMYMAGSMHFARFYFRTVGYWGALVFYSIPALFAFVQCITNSTIKFPGSWALFMLVASIVLWLFCGLIHFFYIDALVMYIDSTIYDGATNLDGCVCSAPLIKDTPADADEETKLAWNLAT